MLEIILDTSALLWFISRIELIIKKVIEFLGNYILTWLGMLLYYYCDADI